MIGLQPSPSTSLCFWLLGRFALTVEGKATTVTSRKARGLLALLALRRGKETERVWLAETLWPESSSEKALFNLRQLLVELRKALGSASHFLLSPTPHSLLLAQEGIWVDTEAFRAWATASQPSAQEGAVALYEGPLLPEYHDNWVVEEREALSQVYLALLETLAQQASAAQAHTTAVGWLRRLIQADPYRESAHRALLEVLAQAGDRAALQQVYQALRRKLKDELNLEPAPETTQLYHALQNRVPTPFAAPPPKVTQGYLPIPLTPLIDREEALQELSVALKRNRLVTLVGPGGIGKTRLSIAVGQQQNPSFAEGVWFVDLAPLTQPERVPQLVLGTLGLKAEAGLSLEDSVVQALMNAEALILFDNCEHVIAACRPLIALLLSRCPRLSLLTTSRESLGITGEQVYPVSPLQLPPLLPPTLREKNPQVLLEYSAVQLFVERVLQVSPRFALTTRNAESVAQICRQLDGLPLALEMAAARVRSLSVQEVEARLTARLQLLTTGSKTALSRHQTLRALIDWSYSLLSEPEQVLFRRLAVFAGGWTLAAAEAVVDLPELEEHLHSLVDKSLVLVEHGATETRYRMLETILEYAHEQLERCPERRTIQERQLDFYRALAAVLEESEGPEDQERVEREQENLRKALDWSRSPGGNLEKGMLLARHLYWYWYDKNYYAEGYSQLKSLLALAPSTAKTQLYSTLTRRFGDMAYRIGCEQEALEQLDHSIALDQELGDIGWEGRGHYLKIAVQLTLGEFEAAHQTAQEALRCFRHVQDLSWEGATLTSLATITRQSGSLEEALAWIHQAEQIYSSRRLDLERVRVWMAQGHYTRAREQLEALLTPSPQFANEFLLPLIDLDRHEGKHALAAAHLTEYLRWTLDVGDRVGLTHGLELAALLLGPQPSTATLLAATDVSALRTPSRSTPHTKELADLRAQLQERFPQALPTAPYSLEQAAFLALRLL